MKERIRIVAIIIRNHKLLLVKGADQYKEFWTPGGGLEDGESELECLKRELHEELNVELVSAKFFRDYVAKAPYDADIITRSRVYIAEISGEIKTGEEIKSFIWMSKKDYTSNKYPLIITTRDKIIPDLIKEKYF